MKSSTLLRWSFVFILILLLRGKSETKFVEEMSWSRKIVLGCSLIGWEVWKTNKVSKRSTCGSVILDWLRPWETKKNMSKSFTYDWDWVILDWVRNLRNQHQDVKKWHWLFLKLSPLMDCLVDTNENWLTGEGSVSLCHQIVSLTTEDGNVL